MISIWDTRSTVVLNRPIITLLDETKLRIDASDAINATKKRQLPEMRVEILNQRRRKRFTSSINWPRHSTVGEWLIDRPTRWLWPNI